MDRQAGGDRPLFFMHIPKTGGTSLSDAVSRLYPPERRFSDGGAVSQDFVDRLGPALRGRCFLFGHPGPGVAARLAATADTITMLRRPAHQAVSNYLQLRADPGDLLFESARRQSFTAFLQENPHQIAYQATSLALAVSTPRAPVDALDRRGPDALLGFLESIAFVGVIERPDDCCAVLSGVLAADPPIAMPCLNSAIFRGVSPAMIEQLHREYEALSADPALGHLFALEALVYAKARSLLAGRVAQVRPPSTAARRGAGPRLWPANRFSGPGGPLASANHVCALAEDAGHLIFGPRYRLGKGDYAVEFQLSVSPDARSGRGRLEIEVLANAADSLARRWLRADAPLTARRRTLTFRNRRDTDILEFRVRARGFAGGNLEFEGVKVRRAAVHRAWPSRIWALLHRQVVMARGGAGPPQAKVALR